MIDYGTTGARTYHRVQPIPPIRHPTHLHRLRTTPDLHRDPAGIVSLVPRVRDGSVRDARGGRRAPGAGVGEPRGVGIVVEGLRRGCAKRHERFEKLTHETRPKTDLSTTGAEMTARSNASCCAGTEVEVLATGLALSVTVEGQQSLSLSRINEHAPECVPTSSPVAENNRSDSDLVGGACADVMESSVMA